VGDRNTGKRQIVADEGKKLAILSVALNIFFTAAKFSLYLLSGSFSLLAETAHSLADVTGSLLVVGGIYLSEKKSERFPWGLYKVENIAALFSACLIFLSAYEIAKMIYHPSPEGMRNLDMTLIVLFLMTVPIILFSRYEARRAKAINSPSLMADAEHWRADIAPIVAVAIGIASARLSYPVMDRISAFAVLLVVIKAGYGIFRDSMKSLMDASVDRVTLDKIKAVLGEFHGVKEVVSLHARNSGKFIFISMDVRLSSKRLKDAHELADRIEGEIERRIPFVEKVTIHYEPEKKDRTRYAVPLADRDDAVSEHFSSAPFIAVWDKGPDEAVISQEILENPFRTLEKRKGISLATFLVEKEIDILYTRESFDGKGPEYVFANAGIKIRRVDRESMNILIKEHDGKSD